MQAARSNSDLRSIQEKVVARQFDAALTDLADVLEADAENAEALYMSAVCLRYKAAYRAALELLARLKAVTPEDGRAHQEEGHTYRDMRQADDALLAYSRACRFNPALEASWRGQLQILTDKGLHTQAAQIRAQLQRLKALPPLLLSVMDLIGQGRLLKAEEICRQFLLQNPQHTEGMRLLASIGMRLGVLDDAEFLLESALQFEPDNVPIRIDYVQALRKRQKFQQALEQARHLLDSAPHNPQFQSLFGVESMQTGHYDDALAAFDKVLQAFPGDPVTLTSKGHVHKTRGDYASAVGAYHAAPRQSSQLRRCLLLAVEPEGLRIQR